MFGWTQLVRSTDSDPDRFEMDPIALYQQIPTPYAFFGVRPELFDAPSRESRYDMDWEAHSFLCAGPDAVLTRRVQAVAGFRWGFTISHQEITFAPLAALESEAWDSHLNLFRTSYLSWNFDGGYL
jgi:hypothetical protein